MIDVNTGQVHRPGGDLEDTITRNNLEAAEEIVRQLRLRDIGGIIVIDFIDMVLESNRELVLRRVLECLARDRTKHQVAEVTSLGLVQMTRKRVGSGLLEAFSEPCECCNGRGLHVSLDLLDAPAGKRAQSQSGRGGGRGEAKSPGDGRDQADARAQGDAQSQGDARVRARATPEFRATAKTRAMPGQRTAQGRRATHGSRAAARAGRLTGPGQLKRSGSQGAGRR